jgi:uncharacterized coiled-coil protein SlyX
MSNESPTSSEAEQLQEAIKEAINTSARWQYRFWGLTIAWLLAAIAAGYYIGSSLETFSQSAGSLRLLKKDTEEFVSTSREQIKALDKKVEDQSGQVDKFKSAMEKLNEKLANADLAKTIETMNGELIKLQSRLTELSNKASAQQQNLEELAKQVKDHGEQVNKFKSAIDKLNEKPTNADLPKTQSMHVDLTGKVTTLEKNLDNLKKRVDELAPHVVPPPNISGTYNIVERNATIGDAVRITQEGYRITIFVLRDGLKSRVIPAGSRSRQEFVGHFINPSEIAVKDWGNARIKGDDLLWQGGERWSKKK